MPRVVFLHQYQLGIVGRRLIGTRQQRGDDDRYGIDNLHRGEPAHHVGAYHEPDYHVGAYHEPAHHVGAYLDGARHYGLA